MKTFLHGGDLGDVIYALPAIRALGGGCLYLSEANYGREPLTAARRDVLVPLLERIDPLFEALAKEIELEGLHLGEDGYVCLVTESKLHIHFQQEDESLLSICELGRMTTDEGRMEMLETLLAANALWGRNQRRNAFTRADIRQGAAGSQTDH